jgi:peptide/nickel transport system ATP-binding protein
MLEAHELCVEYGSGRHALRAVNAVSVSVPSGGTLGLVGESGSGKSTIARALVGLADVVGGRILLDGEDATAQRKRTTRAYRRRVQMVFQDPMSSLNPRMTIGEMLDEAVSMQHGLRSAERRDEVVRAIELVGLDAGALPRYPHQFSGGQRQRIALARALAVRPEVIIMDEVTSALDVSVQASMLNLLRELQTDLNLSYLFISHDLAVVGAMSDVVAVMYLGELVECAPAQRIFTEPAHPYTQGLLDSIPDFAPRARRTLVLGQPPDPRDPPPGCRFHPRCPVGPAALPERTQCFEADPQIDKTQRRHAAACHFAGVPKAAAALEG